MKYKTIAESYSYYNLALIKEKIKKYQIAEEHIRKALEILQEATDININGNFSDELLYFLEDFRDYLYEKCKIQIFQDKKEDYNSTLKILNLICEKVNNLKYYNLRASLEYDIALLKSKIYDSQKKYDKIVEYLERCLDKEENYLSDEEEADLRARLAYGYWKISKFEKCYENINKSVELDPSNPTCLKLISSMSQPGSSKLYSRMHLKQIGITLLMSTAIILFIFQLIVKITISESLSFILLIAFLLSVYIVILYPLITSLKIGSAEIRFKELEIPVKEPKIEI